MILPDVNVLVYAHRRDAEGHERYRRWLEEAFTGPDRSGSSPRPPQRYPDAERPR